MGLDLEPDAELRLGRPDRHHLGAGIARDHRKGPFFALPRRLPRGEGINKEGRALDLPDRPPPTAPDTGPRSLAAFAGLWSLSRTIRHADGLEGRLEGTATLARTGPGRLVYDEAGTLVLGAAEPLLATRRYLWRARGRVIEIAFADGRPFHSLPLGTARHDTAHLCPPDRYAVTYDFSRWPEWRTVWRVEGPRKAYEMTSTYTRLP